MRFSSKRLLQTAALSLLGLSQMAGAITLTFDEDFIQHGTIISDQYSDLGVTIRAENRARDYVTDRAVAFDTNFPYRTADEDLRLDPDQFPNVGNVLIIQEHNGCSASRNLCWPDDEGLRPAGGLFFDFDKVISSLSFNILDIEQEETSFVKFYDGSDNEVKSVRFADLDGAAFGDNVFSEIGSIDLAGLGIRTVEFALGGSGAIDDISVSQVPIPASLSIFALGLIGLQIIRRRIAKK